MLTDSQDICKQLAGVLPVRKAVNDGDGCKFCQFLDSIVGVGSDHYAGHITGSNSGGIADLLASSYLEIFCI